MSRKPAGYSGTPLVRKLGLVAGMRAYVRGAPAEYDDWLVGAPDDVRWLKRPAKDLDFVHLFTASKPVLARSIPTLRHSLADDGMLWVSWPKKSSGVASTVTEDTVREVALPLGLVDVKVCAVDDVWSGLKLVVRRALRTQSR